MSSTDNMVGRLLPQQFLTAEQRKAIQGETEEKRKKIIIRTYSHIIDNDIL